MGENNKKKKKDKDVKNFIVTLNLGSKINI